MHTLCCTLDGLNVCAALDLALNGTQDHSLRPTREKFARSWTRPFPLGLPLLDSTTAEGAS